MPVCVYEMKRKKNPPQRAKNIHTQPMGEGEGGRRQRVREKLKEEVRFILPGVTIHPTKTRSRAIPSTFRPLLVVFFCAIRTMGGNHLVRWPSGRTEDAFAGSKCTLNGWINNEKCYLERYVRRVACVNRVIELKGVLKLAFLFWECELAGSESCVGMHLSSLKLPSLNTRSGISYL